MRTFVAILTVAVLLAWSFPAEAQCAMCKLNAESATETVDAGIGRGLNNGILYLMGIPYLLLGIGAFAFWRHRKMNPKQESGSAAG